MVKGTAPHARDSGGRFKRAHYLHGNMAAAVVITVTDVVGKHAQVSTVRGKGRGVTLSRRPMAAEAMRVSPCAVCCGRHCTDKAHSRAWYDMRISPRLSSCVAK
jgi:hypothetical protein